MSVSSESQVESMPLVIVQGFLGSVGGVSWDCHIKSFGGKSLANRKTIVPSLGAVSSLHDRACELYYSLVGGTVDYGAEHSALHSHGRYGRTFSHGLYPMWSREKPLHFLGHSVGGPTIVKLQHLLQCGHFGDQAHPDMILSVNAVCSPFRGTQLVYTLGESLISAPDVRPFSVGAFLARLVHIVAYFAPFLPPVIDVHADARALSCREASFLSFLKQLWKSDWAASKDATPYDMSFEAMEERESVLEGQLYPNTFYRSHVSIMTHGSRLNANSHRHDSLLSTFKRGFFLENGILYIASRSVGSFDFGLLRRTPSFLKPKIPMATEIQRDAFWDNDGVVPLFSQWHPLPCAMTECRHSAALSRHIFEQTQMHSEMLRPTTGYWIVTTVDDAHHLSLVPGFLKPKEDLYQKAFWTDLGCWLNAIDSQRT